MNKNAIKPFVIAISLFLASHTPGICANATESLNSSVVIAQAQTQMPASTAEQAPASQPWLLELLPPGDQSGQSTEAPKPPEDGKFLEPESAAGVSPPVGGEPKIITSPEAKKQAEGQAAKVIPHDAAEGQEIKEHLAEPKPVSTEPSSGPTTKTRPTVALVLGGGGARGAAHVGILEVFEQAGIPVDYIVGNSAGSIVGGLYSAGVSLETIKKMFFDKSLRKAVIPGFIPPAFLLGPIFNLKHIFSKNKPYAGVFSGDRFQAFLEKKLPRKDFSFEELDALKFSAVAVDLVDGKAYALNSGKMAPAIRASATLVPILRPIEIDGRVLIDGGLRANLPASQARDTGADIVIAIVVDEPLKQEDKTRFRKLNGVVERLSDVVLAVLTEFQLKYADIVINPDVAGIDTLTNKPSDAVKAYEAGKAAAIKALPEIRKRLPQVEQALLPQRQQRQAVRQGVLLQ